MRRPSSQILQGLFRYVCALRGYWALDLIQHISPLGARVCGRTCPQVRAEVFMNSTRNHSGRKSPAKPLAKVPSRGPQLNLLTDGSVIPGGGEAIKRLRGELGVTLEQLSERSGIDKTQLSKYQTGKHAITYEYVKRIAKGLGIETEKVMELALTIYFQSIKHEFKGEFMKNAAEKLLDAGID